MSAHSPNTYPPPTIPLLRTNNAALVPGLDVKRSYLFSIGCRSSAELLDNIGTNVIGCSETGSRPFNLNAALLRRRYLISWHWSGIAFCPTLSAATKAQRHESSPNSFLMVARRSLPKTHAASNALTYDWLSLTAESAAAHPVFALRQSDSE